MTTTDKESVSVLNDLIETCKDGEKGFLEASKEVKAAELKTLFSRFAAERAQYAAELQRQVSGMGESPETSGSVSASLHRGWIDVKSAVMSQSDQAIIDECERGEDSAVKNYREALQKDLPVNVRQIVETQYAGVKAHTTKSGI